MTANDKHTLLRGNFKKNAFSISAVEFFWGMGMPIFMESTFLQIFLRKYQASNFTVGLIPVFFSLGIPLLSLVSVYFFKKFRHKKQIVAAVHVGTALPLFLFGILINFTSRDSEVISLFLILYAAFSMGLGMTLPVWQNFIVKIFNEEDAIKGLAVMGITQNVTKILSSFVILRAVSLFDISKGSVSWIFTVVGILLMSGSLFFLVSTEYIDEDEDEGNSHEGLKWFVQSFRVCLKNRNFILFLLNDFGFYAGVAVISFYGNYATEYCGIRSDVTAGLFVACGFIAGIISQFVFGYFDLLELKKKYFIEKAVTLAGIIILIFMTSTPAFLAASFLMGAGRAIRTLAYPHAMKKLSGQNDATGYFGVAPIILLPVTAGLPVLAGTFLDRFASAGAASYRIMFSGMGFLIIFSFIFLAAIEFRNSSLESGGSR